MRNFYTLAMVLIATVTFAQSKSDLKWKGEKVLDAIGKIIDKHANDQDINSIDTKSKAFAAYKMAALDQAIDFTDENQKVSLIELFYKQYPEFETAVKKYSDSKSLSSKVEFIKVLVKNEEELRKHLNSDQQLAYLHHVDKVVVSTEFANSFLNNDELISFKKEIQ